MTHHDVISRFVRFYRLFDPRRVHDLLWKHICSALFHNNGLILIPLQTFRYTFWRGVSLKVSPDWFLCRRYLNNLAIDVLVIDGGHSHRINYFRYVSTRRITRGSKFWSSKVCEGGESCEAYACRLNFDPPEFHFKINDHVTQFVRKPTFDPLSNWS